MDPKAKELIGEFAQKIIDLLQYQDERVAIQAAELALAILVVRQAKQDGFDVS